MRIKISFVLLLLFLTKAAFSQNDSLQIINFENIVMHKITNDSVLVLKDIEHTAQSRYKIKDLLPNCSGSTIYPKSPPDTNFYKTREDSVTYGISYGDCDLYIKGKKYVVSIALSTLKLDSNNEHLANVLSECFVIISENSPTGFFNQQYVAQLSSYSDSKNNEEREQIRTFLRNYFGTQISQNYYSFPGSVKKK